VNPLPALELCPVALGVLELLALELPLSGWPLTLMKPVHPANDARIATAMKRLMKTPSPPRRKARDVLQNEIAPSL
jgi:hypothetical protein